MLRPLRFLMAGLLLASAISPVYSQALRASSRHPRPQPEPQPPQETGFLNRTVELHGATYHFQVYLPESFRRDDKKPWPVILFLHGRGERGSDGLWQTQVGLPQAVRDHPERWPFVIIMPQCPFANYWTDPEMLTMALAALDRETEEFHLDADRTYLTGLSMGGYGSWELARMQPKRWAAVAVMAGGIFWSYEPERWKQAATLPAEYARAVGRLPLWLFQGSDDTMVIPRQSELMFDALKSSGGRVRLWVYQGVKHDCWTRAYNEPELPRWFLSHQRRAQTAPDMGPYSERTTLPLHPPAIKLADATLDSIAGEYRDANGHTVVTIFRQGSQLFERNPQGDLFELAAETPSVFFYPNGSTLTRLIFERDADGRITSALYRDDRHEERWDKRATPTGR